MGLDVICGVCRVYAGFLPPFLWKKYVISMSYTHFAGFKGFAGLFSGRFFSSLQNKTVDYKPYSGTA